MLKKFRKNRKGFYPDRAADRRRDHRYPGGHRHPPVRRYRQKAFNAAAQSDLKTIKTNLEGYYTDNYFYPG